MEIRFTPQHPVTDPRFLWGREADLEKIFSRLNAERPQSLSIVGGRKIGKTSLINVMDSPQIRSRYLSHPLNYLILKLSLDETSSSGVDSFFKALLVLLRSQNLLSGGAGDSVDGYQCLREFVHAAMDQGQKIIFLLDDFHLITGNRAFPLEFFSFLRSMANSHNVAYVTTSRLELQKFCVIKDVEESPFFNIFTNFNLKLLADKHNRGELEGILVGAELTAEARQAFRENHAFHPYVMQVLGANLQEMPPPQALEKTKAHLAPFFELLWNDLAESEQKVVHLLARGNSLPEPMVHLGRELVKRCLLVEAGDGWSLFTPLFQAWVLDHSRSPAGWLAKLFAKR